ncbi:MAG TPA: hypothetical protein VNT81_17255 [Vicinamibacterales bacterium]|nr:hypothetical protein [Vicinamibacterales bacterium]
MGFHKHGKYSFSIAVQKMSVIGGDRFVADLTGLRRHDANGVAIPLDVPPIAEHYGETPRAAQGKAIAATCRWLDQHTGTDSQVVANASHGGRSIPERPSEHL